LSTERLLALANVPDDERQAILSTQRVGSLVLPGGVIVRDQSPIPPGALAKALPPGITPSDWYRLLNRHVFLWASAERADRHRGAFWTRAALLLVFDSARLLAERGEEVFLSPINSGNARRDPRKCRGSSHHELNRRLFVSPMAENVLTSRGRD
jgi:hypothetical protein